MKLSSPPMVILLDVLFIFLFILILNDKTLIEIIPPKEKNSGLDIIYKNKANFYYEKNQSLYQKEVDYAYFLSCKEREECKAARDEYGKENVYLLLPDNLYSELSMLSILALKTTSCKSIKIYIKNSKSLNYKKMITEQPCLLEIDRMKGRIKN